MAEGGHKSTRSSIKHALALYSDYFVFAFISFIEFQQNNRPPGGFFKINSSSMPDIIQLLPDSIANQIAAGEVVQRPASVVKELLENALDAKSASIRLIIKDAGKTSIQVIDDGKGMSETDERKAFERHATSKIRSADDLFAIRTMGFRGEALASIAAIAHVELVTRQAADELGTKLIIEGSSVNRQEKVQTMPGTSITVKNLFYNVPARRKFLKSDAVELKHITDEFHRIALANPEIHFSFHHNGNELYHLPKGNLKQRIVGILGKNYAEKLIPVQENTDIVAISGFIGKPDAAKKSQADQYIFVNQRFIKSHYVSHAVRTAFEEVIAPDLFPFYFLFLEIDPSRIDINVHPTKTEIKFEEERLVYNYVKVSVKHSLGQYSLSPMLDFTQDPAFGKFVSTAPHGVGNTHSRQESEFGYTSKGTSPSRDGWQEVYQSLVSGNSPTPMPFSRELFSLENEASSLSPLEETGVNPSYLTQPFQLHHTFVLHQVKSGLLVIDQQAAHERVLYEQYLDTLQTGEYASQKELFPRTIQLDPAKAALFHTMLDQLHGVGFEIEDFGHNAFVLHGSPAGIDESTSIETIIDQLIDQYSYNLELHLGVQENIARSLALSASMKRGRKLEKEEMRHLTDRLFACSLPYKSPSGRKCFYILELDELIRRFTQ